MKDISDSEVRWCLSEIVDIVTTFERVAASRNTTDGSERCPIDDQLVCSDLLDDVLGLTKGSSVLVNDAPLPELTDQDLVSNGVIDTEDMELRSNDSEKSKKNTKTVSILFNIMLLIIYFLTYD